MTVLSYHFCLKYIFPPSFDMKPVTVAGRHNPRFLGLRSDLLYYTGSCNVNKTEIRQNFITAIQSSTWKDACPVNTCNVDQVEVTMLLHKLDNLFLLVQNRCD